MPGQCEVFQGVQVSLCLSWTECRLNVDGMWNVLSEYTHYVLKMCVAPSVSNLVRRKSI